jgi:hypothetical protein
MYPQHHVEQQFQLPNPLGFTESLQSKNKLSRQAKKKKLKKNFQHYNILSAYEVKVETSSSSKSCILLYGYI